MHRTSTIPRTSPSLPHLYALILGFNQLQIEGNHGEELPPAQDGVWGQEWGVAESKGGAASEGGEPPPPTLVCAFSVEWKEGL